MKLPGYEEIEEWLLGLEFTEKVNSNTIEVNIPSILDDNPVFTKLTIPDDILAWHKDLEGNEKAHREIRKKTVKWSTFRLDGRSRFQLTSKRPLGNLQRPPTSHLVKLFREAEKRDEWRKMCSSVFPNMHAAIGHTSPSLNVRMGTRPPRLEEETGLDQLAIDYHREATQIGFTGDGVQAFTGLSSVITGFDWRFLLIDDPEAYLHPPVAKRLGGYITSMAQRRGAQVFISTHSSYFLQGCLDASDNVTIIRLTFDPKSKKAGAYTLSQEYTTELAKRPTLRSTRILDALFHKAVIVSEGDTDRIFYEEINRMLVERGIGHPECLIICPHGTAKIGEVVRPLVSIGIPTAAIVDLDLLWDGGKKWNELLRALQISDDCKDTINNLTNSLRIEISGQSISRDDIKKQGIWFLNSDTKSRFLSLLDLLAENGVFCVPDGELESWFKELDIKGKTKSDRVMNCLELVQSMEPEDYKTQDNRPTVWNFVERIAHWLKTGEKLSNIEDPKFRLSQLNLNGSKTFAVLDPIRLDRALISFLNSKDGGNIFIGVDRHQRIVGLDRTFMFLGLNNADELLTYISKRIQKQYSPEILNFITTFVHGVGKKQFCEIVVQQVPHGMFTFRDD
jgi:hypothetical protein